MLIDEFSLRLEKLLKKVIEENYPTDWEEDFITRNILKSFRNDFKKINICGFKDTLKICWESYKLTGKAENLYGDLAIIIKIKFRDGKQIEGVAFLEAKKRKKNTVRFDAIKISQAERIYKNAPHSMMLLYDYEDIREFAINRRSQSFEKIDNYVHEIRSLPVKLKHFKDYYSFFCSHNFLYPRAVAVPSNIIKATKYNSTSLYKFSVPLSYQLCYRFFHGLDLDYAKSALNIAKGFAPQQGIPKYVMQITITKDETEPELEDILNSDTFSRIEE